LPFTILEPLIERARTEQLIDRSPFLEAFAASVAATTTLQERTRVIALGPLAPDEALALAREQLADANQDQVRSIAAESEGNPLFITELSRLVATRLDAAAEHTPAEGRESPQATRAALSDLLAARVLELPGPARAALELIAIAGEPIAARIIRAATGADQRDINRLVNEHLVAAHPSAAGEVVMAWHDRVRETVASRLPPAERASRHETLAVTAAGQVGRTTSSSTSTGARPASPTRRAATAWPPRTRRCAPSPSTAPPSSTAR
jgi:hypothetical protein